MLKMKCIQSVENFEVGKIYEVINNYTSQFEIADGKGGKHCFSKVYDSEYPNFREFFRLLDS
ncbi:hypothetical protein [Bacillus cereus group sp. BfR-BA-01328]|uniref:hypothetical protein n=1 Tax=Bacillus cereus group sp. BfR-BA-01328 TaxID=2920304 RepID=UPI001F56B91C